MDQRHASASVAADELEGLYLALSRRLEQLVRMDVRAPEAVIEDACQIAWIGLVRHSGRVRRDAVLSWLATTAVREAYRLTRRESRELSLDAALEQADGLPGLPRSPGPHEVLEQRERLAEIRALPQRQQRLLWLHAFGYSYTEMAAHDGITRRTVERQLLRAKGRVREAGMER